MTNMKFEARPLQVSLTGLTICLWLLPIARSSACFSVASCELENADPIERKPHGGVPLLAAKGRILVEQRDFQTERPVGVPITAFTRAQWVVRPSQAQW